MRNNPGALRRLPSSPSFANLPARATFPLLLYTIWEDFYSEPLHVYKAETGSSSSPLLVSLLY